MIFSQFSTTVLKRCGAKCHEDRHFAEWSSASNSSSFCCNLCANFCELRTALANPPNESLAGNPLTQRLINSLIWGSAWTAFSMLRIMACTLHRSTARKAGKVPSSSQKIRGNFWLSARESGDMWLSERHVIVLRHTSSQWLCSFSVCTEHLRRKQQQQQRPRPRPRRRRRRQPQQQQRQRQQQQQQQRRRRRRRLRRISNHEHLMTSPWCLPEDWPKRSDCRSQIAAGFVWGALLSPTLSAAKGNTRTTNDRRKVPRQREAINWNDMTTMAVASLLARSCLQIQHDLAHTEIFQNYIGKDKFVILPWVLQGAWQQIQND